MCLCYLFSAKTAWQLVNRKADFFYKTNRFESIRVTNRTESIRIANWNALLDRPICAGGADTPPCYAPVVGGGIKRYRDPSVCLSAPGCSSPRRAAALGCRHSGCLQLSHRRPPEVCGLRTHPRTGVDPPRVELPSMGGISSRRPRCQITLTTCYCQCRCSVPSITHFSCTSATQTNYFLTQISAVSLHCCR